MFETACIYSLFISFWLFLCFGFCLRCFVFSECKFTWDICIDASMSMSTCTCICARICARIFIWICKSIHTCTCRHTYVYTCLFIVYISLALTSYILCFPYVIVVRSYTYICSHTTSHPSSTSTIALFLWRPQRSRPKKQEIQQTPRIPKNQKIQTNSKNIEAKLSNKNQKSKTSKKTTKQEIKT